jgi:hypothetical protein
VQHCHFYDKVSIWHQCRYTSWQTNNGATATITWGTRPAEGDYTVVVIGSPSPLAAIGTMVTTGYTLLTSHTGAAAANPSLAIYYKKQPATTDTTAAGVSGNSGDTDSSLIGFVKRR